MKLNTPQINQLIKALLAVENLQEMRKFLRDLLTEEEILEFSKRWQAAQMLQKGIPYITIVDKTGLSSTTVARVAKWLKSGKGGYRLVLARLAHHHNPSFEKRLH
ncbi:MAG: YerC/YecD family TrpR-related protein [Candidatus Komeilibacteria bacterium]|nr:YerC/YecD family TrpR-related protein [Candidatus Komeilibacteria bacterium]